MEALIDHGIDSKIVVMGNSGVGKTSLLQRYTQNKFDPKNTTSTSGAFFVTKKVYVNGLKVRLQLWDTAGQERFRSMVRYFSVRLFSFLIVDRLPCTIEVCACLPPPFVNHNLIVSGANAALVLYDITNASTFNDIRGWLQGSMLLVTQIRCYMPPFRTKKELPARTSYLHCWCKGGPSQPKTGYA